MARKDGERTRGLGRLLGAAKAVKKMFSRGHEKHEETSSRTAAPSPRPAQQPARITQRQSDIPLDLLANVYTPADTSSKASFRSSGKDHYDDQEFAMGVVDERWNDEDRLTNKSGDPRIGTHRRTYEPDEARAGSHE